MWIMGLREEFYAAVESVSARRFDSAKVTVNKYCGRKFFAYVLY